LLFSSGLKVDQPQILMLNPCSQNDSVVDAVYSEPVSFQISVNRDIYMEFCEILSVSLR
jgi:hypothetical protein